jgi:hypothetical protein
MIPDSARCGCDDRAPHNLAQPGHSGRGRYCRPAASAGFSGAPTPTARHNPLRHIDITGLFSWDEFLVDVQDISGIVSDVAGVLAIPAAVTGAAGAPLAGVLRRSWPCLGEWLNR